MMTSAQLGVAVHKLCCTSKKARLSVVQLASSSVCVELRPGRFVSRVQYFTWYNYTGASASGLNNKKSCFLPVVSQDLKCSKVPHPVGNSITD